MKSPAASEVAFYWTESKLAGDPAEFYDHFEANGWVVGKVPMKNWQAAARNWSRNEVKWGRSSTVNNPHREEDSEREAEAQRLAAEEIAEIERLRSERFS